MADKAFSTTANGTASTLTITGPASGLQWIIWQLSVSTQPYRASATATVKRNGLLLTSTFNGGSDAAQGPPAIILTASDTMTVDWASVTSGDELVCVLMYEEVQWGQIGTGVGIV